MGFQPKLRADQVVEIRAAWLAGEKAEVIGMTHGVTAGAVSFRCRDLPRRQDRYAKDADIREQFALGLTIYRIAKNVGMTQRGVKVAVARMGLSR